MTSTILLYFNDRAVDLELNISDLAKAQVCSLCSLEEVKATRTRVSNRSWTGRANCQAMAEGLYRIGGMLYYLANPIIIMCMVHSR